MKKTIVFLFFALSSFLFGFEELNIKNFDQKIAGKKVIVDFYTSWWGACQVLGQNLTKFNTSKPKDVEIYKVDIDKEDDLTEKFNIYSMPTLIYFKNGKLIAKEPGVKSIKQLTENVKKYLK